ncbi:activating molecule in BECN1-regulated autophagy protein 1-like [Anarrhichthys ocellatus]|uniref:activating molecule in BECN1-regulated autophagy protein 1-like n=1 Tax=Anarrhichthys ocellatus TaxID=433405 RepID=UPI0012EDD414|nr:activating molecule in BECN1-regulated autophagy protein 1-like [Anarrhichthys ocellatus]
MREGGVGPGMLPPRTSSSSISLLSVLRQQDGSSHSPVYTSASEGRGFPQQGEPPGSRDTAGTSSGHHPFWDGSRGNTASFRNVLQCNLSRYFMEFDRMQDLEPPLGGGGGMADGSQEQNQELLNNNMDPDRPGPSSSTSTSSPTIIHYQPPLPPPPAPHNLENNVPPPASRGHLNRCRACHNLLTFNHDSQRWERTNQASSTSASTLEPSSSSSSSSAFPSSSSSPWQPEESRRTLETPESRVPPEPSEQPPPPGGGGGTVAFPIAPTPTQTGEQTVGLVYNQDTAQWERVYRQAAAGRSAEPPDALSQEMPVDPPDEDSLRRRLLESSLLSLSRYDMSGSRDHPIYPDPARYTSFTLIQPGTLHLP